ncbi:hypothetical protein RND81_10G246500 [Saponaria officinalis]|uniref:RING-type E3 ubiquitin transferase n=1 Tax=Saponaria officinalis TaxID=3572 RepID=A0AAW1I7C8_SAPOF
METNSVRCLTNSLSRFIHLMSCQTWKSMPTQYLKCMATLLKHLKPLLDDIDEEKITSDSNLWKACENLDDAVNAARDFIERWSPKMSKILSVLRSEQLLTNIKSYSLELCGILCRLPRTSPPSSGLGAVQHCIQELQSWKTDRISKHIEQALKGKNGKLVSSNEHLAEIVDSLSLMSNHELLSESIAVEKERMKAQAIKSDEKMDQINEVVDLLDLIREYLLKNGCSGSLNGVSIPPYFRCPLSLEFMLDPVIVASGQTFEKSSIQKWVENGLRVCPKTRQYLSHINLIPNYTVKALIANWLEDNDLKPQSCSEINIVNTETSESNEFSSQDIIPTDSFHCSVHSSDSISICGRLNIDEPSISEEVSSSHRSPEHSYTHSRSQSAGSVLSSSDYLGTESDAVCNSKVIRAFSLQSSDSGYDETTTSAHVDELVKNLRNSSNLLQTEAALELRLLAKHNMENRVIIGKCGAIGPLISLLYSGVKTTQEHAITALLNLSLNEENKSRIAETDVIEPLVHVLKTGNDAAKENSAATLFSLSLLEDYKLKIGRSGAIKPLVNLLARGTVRGKKDALTALFNLSICHDNKPLIVQAGAVKYLVQLLDPSKGMVDKSIALLANLSTISEGRLKIAREQGIPLIVEIVDTGTQRGKENAAAVLLQLCLNSSKFCNMVLEEGAVPPLVGLSQSGTPRAKEKAQQLLSHFRNQREGANKRKS